MKTNLLLSLLPFILSILSCRSFFVIDGTAPHLQSGYVYMENNLNRRVDSFAIVNHNFYYKIKIDEPTYYNLKISGREPGRNYDYTANRNIWLQRGSHAQIELGAVVAPRITIKNSDVEEEEKAYRKNKPDPTEYITTHPDSYLSARNLYYKLSMWSEDKDNSAITDQFNHLTPRIQSSQYGKAIQNYLGRERSLQIGQIFPDFTQPDTVGNKIRLSSIKARYLLVDFWASWCGPCRAENPAVKIAYEKYHPRGFEIIGVSKDDDKAKWIEAIKDDRLHWKHVSDLKKFDDFSARDYHILAIPDNFLLDKNGRIIARGLRGEELEKKLAELM